MARRRLYGETQKRRKKLSTARLKRHVSPQRVEATQLPAPFERSERLERQDLEFLEAMRELQVVPNRRRAVSPGRLEQVESVQFVAERQAEDEFLQAMNRMGVRPLRGQPAGNATAGSNGSGAEGSGGPVPAAPGTAPAPAAKPATGSSVLDTPRAASAADPGGEVPPPEDPGGTRFESGGPAMAELLAGDLDPAAKYEGAPPPAEPRRPPREPEVPDDELDVHGRTQEEAIHAVQAFLLGSHKRRYRAVLIITGKGTNSGDRGPVLRDAVYHWLERNGERFARSFRWAPPRFGGSGAIWISLR